MNTGAKLLTVGILLVAYLLFGSYFLSEVMFHGILDIIFLLIIPLCTLMSFIYMKGFINAKKESFKAQGIQDNIEFTKECCFFEMRKSGFGKTRDTQLAIQYLMYAGVVLFPIGRIFRRFESLLSMSQTIWIGVVGALIMVLLVAYLCYVTTQYFGYKGIEFMLWQDEF